MNGVQLAVYETMKNFINAKYYETEDKAKDILKAFQVTEDITPDQYTELALLARNVYNPLPETVPMTDIIPAPVPTVTEVQ